MTKVRSREQLVEAATRVFGRKGFDATRLEDIAAELGLLKGSLYYYVSSKSELFYLVLKSIYEPMVEKEERAATSAASPRQKLSSFVQTQLEHYADSQIEPAVLFSAGTLKFLSPEERAVIEGLHQRMADALRGIIREGIQAGELRGDLDAGAVMMGIFGMCNWLPRWYKRDGPLTIQEIAGIFVELLLHGLRRQPVAHGEPRLQLVASASDGRTENGDASRDGSRL